MHIIRDARAWIDTHAPEQRLPLLRIADNITALDETADQEALAAEVASLLQDYVIDETLTLIRMRLGIVAAKAWWTQIEGSSRLRWEWIATARSEKARTLFFRYRDKDYSFTDCTSFVVMHELRLKQVLTGDHHFRQMGFDIMPPPTPKRR